MFNMCCLWITVVLFYYRYLVYYSLVYFCKNIILILLLLFIYQAEQPNWELQNYTRINRKCTFIYQYKLNYFVCKYLGYFFLLSSRNITFVINCIPLCV